MSLARLKAEFELLQFESEVGSGYPSYSHEVDIEEEEESDSSVVFNLPIKGDIVEGEFEKDELPF